MSRICEFVTQSQRDGRDFVCVILGGDVAASYAALEFTDKGASPGELGIISEEPALKLEEFEVKRSDAKKACYFGEDVVCHRRWLQE